MTVYDIILNNRYEQNI